MNLFFSLICQTTTAWIWKKKHEQPYKKTASLTFVLDMFVFVCVKVLRLSQSNGVMSSVASLPN